MQVSVETLEGLERKVTVSVPTQQIEEEVKSRLKSLAQKVKIDGFRPGKVPVNIVTQKYSDSVRLEVAKDLIEPTLQQALKDNELNLAGHPSVELQVLEKDKDFKYTASFEVYPTIDVKELDKASVEQIQSEVTDKDVSEMLEKLQNQHADWVEVSTPAKNGNKALIDFEGFLNDELFEGGSAKQHELTLGSATMIPGFEEGIVGKKAGEVFDIQVKFPEDYGHEKLSNKEARFKITLHKVTEPKLPELDDAFAERFNIKEGGIEALKKDIKENMVRELEKRISMLNREKMFNKLLEANPITLPASLVDSEIESLKHDAYHRIFGHEHHDNEKIPDFPRELFEAQAKNRVHLGLIFSEYIKKHNIVVDEERINVTIEKIASAYESPEELRQLYKTNKRHKSEIQALVMEEIVAEHIGKDATISYVTKGYDAVMNPKGAEEQGE